LNIIFPSIYMSFLNILFLFNLNLRVFHLDCIYRQNFYDELVQATLAPFFLFTFIWIVLTIRLLIAYRVNAANPSYDMQKYRRGSIFAALIISFVLFSPISILIFQTFACDTFDDGSSYLIADYSISCNTDEHKFYTVYASVMVLVYPIGVPSVYLWLLRVEKDKVNPRTELVVRDDERHLVSESVIQQEKIKLRDSYQEIKYISFLYETYQPRRWYFEIIDCFRRLSLTAVPVLILRGTIAQIVLVLLFSLACVAAYTELKPFVSKSDNLVAIVTQWAITLTLIVALMLEAGSSTNSSKALLGAISLVVNIFVFLMTFYVTVAGEDDEDELASTANTLLSAKKVKKKKFKLSKIVDTIEANQQAREGEGDRDGEGEYELKDRSVSRSSGVEMKQTRIRNDKNTEDSIVTRQSESNERHSDITASIISKRAPNTASKRGKGKPNGQEGTSDTSIAQKRGPAHNTTQNNRTLSGNVQSPSKKYQTHDSDDSDENQSEQNEQDIDSDDEDVDDTRNPMRTYR
jgi:hypothetical protein